MTQSEIYATYHELHCRCPNCGGDSYSETTAGFVIENLETDKDLNQVHCACGWIGIVHDLVARLPTQRYDTATGKFVHVAPDGTVTTETVKTERGADGKWTVRR